MRSAPKPDGAGRCVPLAAGCLLLSGLTLSCGAWGAPPAHDKRALDLRAPPAAAALPAMVMGRAGPGTRGAPSVTEYGPLQSLGVLRMQDRLEILARRVRREGLPLARLWEGRSALISLGLSPKGRPGLWLIQKIP